MTDLPNNVQARLEAAFDANRVEDKEFDYSLQVLRGVEQAEDTRVLDNDGNGVVDQVSTECIALLLHENRDALTDEDIKDPHRFNRLVRRAWLKFLERYDSYNLSEISNYNQTVDELYHYFGIMVANINAKSFDVTEISKGSATDFYDFIKSAQSVHEGNGLYILDEFFKDLAVLEGYNSCDAVASIAKYVTCWKQICTALVDGVSIDTLHDKEATEEFISLMGVISNGWYEKRSSGKNISRNLQNVMIQLIGGEYALSLDTDKLINLASLFDLEKTCLNKLQDTDQNTRDYYRGKKLTLSGRHFGVSTTARTGNILLETLERQLHGYSYVGFYTGNGEVYPETSADFDSSNSEEKLIVQPLDSHDRLQLISNLKSTIDSSVRTSTENLKKLNELWITINDFYTDIVCSDLWLSRLSYLEKRIINFSACYLLLECISPLLSYQQVRMHNLQRMVEYARILTNAKQ